jgi:hypothetical protein
MLQVEEAQLAIARAENDVLCISFTTSTISEQRPNPVLRTQTSFQNEPWKAEPADWQLTQ